MIDLSQLPWMATMVVGFLVFAAFYYTIIKETGNLINWLRSDT
ncbi:hypothetical protein [Halorubellus sp. PRR65]|nr:hypothetical protein [Halorubellus sp. PRR65]